MFPESVFDEFLESLTLDPPRGDHQYSEAELIPVSYVTDKLRSFSEPPVRVWYRTDCKIGFDRFVDRLREVLHQQGHQSNDGIAGAVTALYVLRPDRHSRPTATLNQMLSEMVTAQLAQFLIFSHSAPPGFQRYTLGQFTIGVLRSKNLRRLSRDAGSDYFDRYSDGLIGRYAIERDAVAATVINWNQFSSHYNLELTGDRVRARWNRGVHAYFGAVADAYFERFWEILDETQHILT